MPAPARERVIVTGGRSFGETRPRGEPLPPALLAQRQRERDFVSTTLHRELRVREAWAFDRLLVVVGDCPTGVDAIVRDACEAWGLHVKVYVADWHEFGRRAGPYRNGQMVADGAIRCLAFPGGRGTADCMRQAAGALIPVSIFSP